MAYIVEEKDIANTVRDFVIVCDYIENNNPAATQKGDFSVKACCEINQLVSRPEENVTPKSKMDRYISLVLLFHVAKESGLIDYSVRQKGKVFFEVTEKYVAFKSMNVFSQYMFIFHTWLCYVDPEKMYDRMGIFSVDEVFSELSKADPVQWRARKENHHYSFGPINGSSIQGLMSLHYKATIHFMDLGLLVCKKGVSTYHNEGYPVIEKLKPTIFGIHMMEACETRRHSWFNEYSAPAADIDEAKAYKQTMKALEKGRETFLAPFVSLFPKETIDQETIAKILFEYEKEDNRIFDFKVSFGRDFRFTVRCSPGHSFEDLHLEIQEALKFDNDHLYSFFLDGKRWSNNAVNSPYSEEPPYTDETLLGDVRLRDGQRILYLFDYGDCWQFDITVKTITEAVATTKLELINVSGLPPEQYPAYDW